MKSREIQTEGGEKQSRDVVCALVATCRSFLGSAQSAVRDCSWEGEYQTFDGTAQIRKWHSKCKYKKVYCDMCSMREIHKTYPNTNTMKSLQTRTTSRKKIEHSKSYSGDLNCLYLEDCDKKWSEIVKDNHLRRKGSDQIRNQSSQIKMCAFVKWTEMWILLLLILVKIFPV